MVKYAPFGAYGESDVGVRSRQSTARELHVRVIELVGDKWALLILYALRSGPRRNGELTRVVEGVSQKMLTQTLRKLSASGLVERRDMRTVPPHVEYALTPLGQSLDGVMRSLDTWFEQQLAIFRDNKPAQIDASEDRALRT